MEIKQVYQPIEKEFKKVEEVLCASLGSSKSKSILKVNRFLLESGGKKLRPAMVILSAKAAKGKEYGVKIKSIEHRAKDKELIKVAAAIELIHRASLIHDDVIDHAELRHYQPTINHKWGQDVAIAAGDYLYAEAFRLIAECGNSDVLGCISTATKLMCEGELQQVCERDNFDLLKQQYLIMVKKKTAALFAASCQAGAMLVNPNPFIQNTLKEYGLNFGIAFQIVDDCLDLIGEAKDLGKTPGADFMMGELTLPALNLLSESKDKKRMISWIKQPEKNEAFKNLRERFIHSEALLKTKEDACSYIQQAKRNLSKLNNSCFKESFFALADYVVNRIRL